jgi:hypothetical protein
MRSQGAEQTSWDNSMTEVDHTPSALFGRASRHDAVPGAPATYECRRIGPYMMYEEIARGGMAAVHMGRSLEPGAPRAVAIKHLYRWLAWNPTLVAMFLDEGRLTARVRHPNVVAPLDFVVQVHEGELYLVMEYVHGETLAELLARSQSLGTPSPSLAVGIMIGVLRGLNAAHEATTEEDTPLEIVHRDISPSNIMVGADGVTRVLDFGVARANVQDALTDHRQLRGKPWYLAPEQIRNEPVDRRADVYSAAVVLWEMLAGRRLFKHSDTPAAWDAILSGEIPPPSRYNREVPAALDAAVLTGMARDRARRFPDAQAFANAIALALPPASRPHIAAWVQQVSGEVLAERATRMAAMMADKTERAHQPVAPLLTLRAALPSWTGVFGRFRREAGAGIIAAVLSGLIWWSVSTTRQAGAHSGTPASLAATALAMTMKAVPAPLMEMPPIKTAAASEEISQPATAPSEPDRRAVAPLALALPPPEAEIPATESVPREITPEITTEITMAEADAPAESDEPGQPVLRRRARLHGRWAALARIGAMSDRGLEQYRRGQLDTARRLLQTALTACSKAGFDHHTVKAITHARLGLVLVGGYKQPQLGVEQFRKALRIDPSVPLARRDLKPEVTAAFRQAVART